MLKTISLFSGIGGLDFGFEEAGFETRVALELDRYCCRTIRLNRNWSVIEGDVNAVSSAELLRQGGLAGAEADMLIGGPGAVSPTTIRLWKTQTGQGTQSLCGERLPLSQGG